MTQSKFISLRKCAELLTADGDSIKNPALGRYVKKHNLQKGTGPRRAVLVDYDEVKSHRAENFTREWMSTGKSKSKNTSPPKATSKASPPKSAEDSASADPASNKVVKLDRAREAKTTREEALAQQALLDLEIRLGNVIYLDQAEAGLALAADALRDKAQGSGASDFADLLISKFKLPSAVKREILTEIKKYGADFQGTVSDSFAALVSSLTNDDLTETRSRHDALADTAYRLRNKPAKSKNPKPQKTKKAAKA